MSEPLLWKLSRLAPQPDHRVVEDVGWEDRIEECWLVSDDFALEKPTRVTTVRYETTDDR
jgi:hypothetical protein